MSEWIDLASSLSPRSVSARRLRIGGILMIICGLFLVLLNLLGFLMQGSQIRTTAKVLSERCHPQYDIALNEEQTRCDAAVRFTTTTGRVITTSVGDAFPSEFHGSGASKTIDLRYDSNDPTAPFKQSNYMSLDSFVVLTTIGCAMLVAGCWAAVRADHIAQRARERSRRLQGRARR